MGLNGEVAAWQLPGSVMHLVLSKATARTAARCFSVSRNWRDVGSHGSLLDKIRAEKPVEIARELGWEGLQELEDNKDGHLFRDSEYERSLLHWAAKNNHVSLAKASLSAGIEHETRDFFGCTPLMLAAYYGSKETLELLCEAGGFVDAADDFGRTSLCFAAWMGCETTTMELIARGANINKTDEDGWSPLMYAAYGCHHSVVNILLRAGADVEQRSSSAWLEVNAGSTAAQIAEFVCDFELAKNISLHVARKIHKEKKQRVANGRTCSHLPGYFPGVITSFFGSVSSYFPFASCW